jgi:hypothetical protein
VAYDEEIARRVRAVLADRADVVEKKMFGGLAFMVRGHMCCGVQDRDLVVRLGAEQHEVALACPHARAMDFTGRPMKGFVYVAPEGCVSEGDLKGWVEKGLEYALSLPPKPVKG